MKKYSIEARELLSAIELYDIKAGGGNQQVMPTDTPSSCTFCQACVSCTSCLACNTKAMDVIVVG